MRYRLALLLLTTTAGANADPTTVRIDVWADNWFSIYSGEQLIAEDPVPFKTERSFNSETYNVDLVLPAQINLIIKDFKENDTGLEYIGSRRQQMGDGGFIAQFFDAASGELLAASGENWRCKTIHRAPLNKDCERDENPEQSCQTEILPEPAGWKDPGFDDSDWPRAVIHSAWAVQPRRGYDEIDWRPEAKLIWTDDLVIDNTVICRFTLQAAD